VTEAFVLALPGGSAERLTRSDGGGQEPGNVPRFDVGDLAPQVAAPPTVGDVHPVAARAGARHRARGRPVSAGHAGGGRADQAGRRAAGHLRVTLT
jgi:hypothetical protein